MGNFKVCALVIWVAHPCNKITKFEVLPSSLFGMCLGGVRFHSFFVDADLFDPLS